jgi:hypothetical protein
MNQTHPKHTIPSLAKSSLRLKFQTPGLFSFSLTPGRSINELHPAFSKAFRIAANVAAFPLVNDRMAYADPLSPKSE